MPNLPHRTKIIATLGPASTSPAVLRSMIQAGMSVARLNFSHGSYDDHRRTLTHVRQVSGELGMPVTILQDLQGPKIRVGTLPDGGLSLQPGNSLKLVPLAMTTSPTTSTEAVTVVGIDYPHLAEDATPGTQVLLDDGLLELTVTAIQDQSVLCEVIRGGLLKSRKGVNLPDLTLRLPSLTEKDQQDLAFGLEQGIDWVSLSFVRTPADLQQLKSLLAASQADVPVIAKIEKPQAIENLEGILDSCDGVMVARGDLGVEMRPERVPGLQKQIIRRCNEKGIPVITATQMLESMIQNPRPTRAEASDVANAILDGTDAVMLSGESAVGNYPVAAVTMMAQIALEVEKEARFVNFPPVKNAEANALSEALNTVDKILQLRCIVAFTRSGYTAQLAAAERPQAPVVAITTNPAVYHRLSLIWGVRPLLVAVAVDQFESMLEQAEACLREHSLADPGDTIVIIGGLPTQQVGNTNFLKIHSMRP
jgi:pyruvate kinase